MRKHLQAIGPWSNVIRNGKFSIKLAYQFLKGNVVKAPWKSIVCSNPTPPRATFITWLVLHDKLRTKEVVASWGGQINQQCALCVGQTETFSHLF